MRTLLLHNPTAGDDQQPTSGQLKALMVEAGHKVHYQSTKDEGWDKALSKALKQQIDLVVVAGGDGTVGRVARRMIGSGMPMAVLPLGTANNVSRTLGIAHMPVTQLIPSWASARRVKFDAGLARGPWGERHFIEGVGSGLLTHSIPRLDASKTLKTLTETAVRVSYAQQLFREHVAESPAHEVEATLDGKDISGRYVLFEVLNMQYVGPNLFLGPNVMRDDGEFEVICVSESHRRKLHRYIQQWQDGHEWPHELRALRGSRVEMQWRGGKMHLDDRIWPDKGQRKPRAPATVELTVEPGALEFLIPEKVHARQLEARRNAERARARKSK